MTLPRPVGIITPEMVAEANQKYQAELAEKAKAKVIPKKPLVDDFEKGQRKLLSDDSLIIKRTSPNRVAVAPEGFGIETWSNGHIVTGDCIEHDEFAGMVTAYLNLVLEQLPCNSFSSGVSCCSRADLAEIVENITNYTGMFLSALTNGSTSVQETFNTLVVPGDRHDISLNPDFRPYCVDPRVEDAYTEPIGMETSLFKDVEDSYDGYTYDRLVDACSNSVDAWDYYDNPYYDHDTPPSGFEHKLWDWYDFENAWNPEILDELTSDSFICDINCEPYMIDMNGKPITSPTANMIDYCPASPDDMVLPTDIFAIHLEKEMQEAIISLGINPVKEGFNVSPAMMYMLIVGNQFLADYVVDSCSLYKDQCVEMHTTGRNWNRYRKLCTDVFVEMLGFNLNAPSGSMEEAECIDAADIIATHIDNAAYYTYVDFHKKYTSANKS